MIFVHYQGWFIQIKNEYTIRFIPKDYTLSECNGTNKSLGIRGEWDSEVIGTVVNVGGSCVNELSCQRIIIVTVFSLWREDPEEVTDIGPVY